MKKILFLTSIISCVIAITLVIPNNVFAAPGEEAQLIVNDICIYDEAGGTTGTVAGATYDLTTNKLELNDFSGTNIKAIGMGSDFKIEVLGTNTLNSIYVEENPNAMMPFQDSVEFIGKGNLNVNIEQGFAGMAGIHSMGNIIINDVNITIISNDNTAQHMDGICADNSLKVNSGTIKISGNIYIGMISGGEEVIVNGGTITISAKGLGIGSPTGITINGGLLTLTSDEIALHSAYDINIKGGKIVLDGKICAIIVEMPSYEPNIILDSKMEVEEDTTIVNGIYNDGYVDFNFETFGKGTVTFDPQTREYTNVAKKLTIKEKSIQDEVTPEQKPADSEEDKKDSIEYTDTNVNDNSSTDENKNASEKDNTPKTGSTLYEINVIIVVAIILLGAILILKENK